MAVKMKYVFSNATVLSGEDFEVVNGYVVVEDTTIEEVGEGSYAGKSVDVDGGIIFPSFTNSHVHLGDSVVKDIGAYRDIEERVGKEGIKHRVLEEKSSEVSRAIDLSLRKMLVGGTTVFCDFREGGLKGINQLKSAIETPMDGIIMGRQDSDSLDEVLENCDGIGVSSVRDYSEEELDKISKIVKERSKLLGVHVGEVEDDLEKAITLDPDFMVHLTNVGEESLEKILERNMPVVLCPRANAMLGVGLPSLKELFLSRPQLRQHAHQEVLTFP